MEEKPVETPIYVLEKRKQYYDSFLYDLKIIHDPVNKKELEKLILDTESKITEFEKAIKVLKFHLK
jgi:hypothetical protein